MKNESKYKDFLVRDFLCDEYFQDWVMHPDSEKNQFWQQWLLQNPEKEAVVALAKETLTNLDFKVNRPSLEKGKESLEKTWAIIDGLEESKLTSKESEVVPINAQEQIGNKYLEEEQASRQNPVVYRLLTSLAIAASVLLVIGLGWKLFVGTKVETPVAQKTKEKKDSIVFFVRHEVNTTGKEKSVQLPDGTLITLADKSEITYKEPFTTKRDITLNGKAFFKVAKDQTRPFTVISGAIATTVLGTEFTVTAFAKAAQITVRLYEGKVVIKPVEKQDWRMKKDFYLTLGQEFVYSDQALAKVRAFNIKNTAQEETTKTETTRDNPSLPQNTKGPWYMFNNQSLGQVFDQLADMYQVQIVYNKEDVANKYFVGKFNKSDSLDIILNYITKANRLTFTKNENTYYISK